MGTVVTIMVLAYITFALRVYTRVTRGSWGLEDTCMSIATVGTFRFRASALLVTDEIAQVPLLVLSISCLLAAFHGIGIHQVTLNLPENAIYKELGLFVS